MRIEKRELVILILVLVAVMSKGVFAIGIHSFEQQRPMADQNGNKLFDDLERELATGQGGYPVILHLTEAVTEKNLVYLQNQVGEFTPTYIYQYLNSFATYLSSQQIRHLQTLPLIEKIQWDAPVVIYMDTATEGYGISQARREFQVDGDRDGDPDAYSPQDVVIAMIDTGIDVGHVDLPAHKVIAWADLIKGSSTPYDDHGHGTHVAGIAAGLGWGNGDYTGVAPGAALVIVKGLDQTGKGQMSFIDAGIEWLIRQQNQLGIDILNLSFGTLGTGDGTDSTSRLVNLATDMGISVVTAAGNQGNDRQTLGSPAVAEKGIAVGAMADSGEGGDFLAYFTSRGPTLDGRQKPDLVAPGWRIAAPKANTQTEYAIYSGTSMAAPFTAGSIALLLDLYPDLTPAQVKRLLFQSAEDWGPMGWDVDYGMGQLDIVDALALLINPEGSQTANYGHQQGEEDLPADGFYDQWSMELTSTGGNLAITMISELTADGDDLNLYLYDPNGNLVAKGERTGRQEWISYQPQQTGTYTLEVLSYRGSGDYYLDIQGNVDFLYLDVDNSQ